MYSTRDHDGSPNSNLFRPRSKIGDDGHLTIVSCDGLAHNGLSNSILAVWGAQILEQLRAVRVSIRIAMCQIHIIIFILELHLKSKGVVEAASLFLQRVLEVAYVLAVTVPADTLPVVAVRHFLGVEERLHPLIVGALWLHKVYEIELVGCELPCVRHFEVKPLGISCSVMVVLQDQVIFILANLHSAPKVSRLKSALEDQGVVIFVLLLIIGLEL